MEGYTLILTVVIVITAIFVLERIYQTKIKKNTIDTIQNNRRKNYRDDGFTEIMKINEASLHHGMPDKITSLPGRQIFDERLDKTLEYSKKYNKIFSVMVLNIDQFNNINQVYGEAFGNRLLIETANRLKTVLRQIDTISRYTSDSFFFILPELSSPEIAVLVAQRIQDSIIQPFYIEESRVFITACIGIAIYSLENSTSENLVRNAHEALSNAKLAGRNTYRIHNFIETSLTENPETLEEDFESTDFLEKMVVYYQPYLDINSNKTVIIQALPHFNHHRMGLIPYNKFHTALEENSRHDELGEWQLRKVLEQIEHWEKNGFFAEKIMLSVSLSQFEKSDFFSHISGILDDFGIDKSRIILDISKRHDKESNETFKAVLQTVRNTGMNVCIGIMELGRLALHSVYEFPIDYLKIDEKLVKNLILRVENEPIITSLIAVSSNANVKVIAEGVDFENQKNKLIELGVHIMQGRYFAPPIPANELFDMEISKTSSPIDH